MANFGSADAAERWLDPKPIVLRPRSKQPTPPVQIPRADNIVTSTGSAAPWFGGVENPYGGGLKAYEPDTEVLHDPGVDDPILKGYDDAFNAVQQSRAEEAAKNAEPTEGSLPQGMVSSPAITGHGTVQSIMQAAYGMLGKPYVWGGTTSAGVDCSGLIAYAFRSAGVDMPRYRAIDYGRMGQQVAADAARPGDLVFWDNPNTDTDHVGLYIGNGQVIQAPQTGDVVKVSKVWGNPTYRRIIQDNGFGELATPSGNPVLSYGGRPASEVFTNRGVSVATPTPISGRGGRTRWL